MTAGVLMTAGVPPASGAPSTDESATGLRAGGSVEEAWLTGAAPGDRITLLSNGGHLSGASTAGSTDPLGSLIVRDLAPGPGYQWVDDTTGRRSSVFSVLAPGQNPPRQAALYTGQPMHEGLNYLKMRDGIELAATVRYPYRSHCSAASPCPTVIEYSGYDTAAPTDPIPSLLASALHEPCHDCGDPNLLPDTATAVGSLVARVSGFATVSLQMRGSGCSGGAFDLFGFPSDYDAYDAIEIVAHQSWVLHHAVGMVGISFSGLSQLPAAGTDPPDLAAIAPMSPTDDLFSTGYPGGIDNNGFAASWLAQRVDDAKPAAGESHGRLVPLADAPITGVAQPWTYFQIDAELAASDGRSSTCLTNQALHGQSQSLEHYLGPQLVAPGRGPGRAPALFDRRSMVRWARHITVPVFLSGALQDDQTGPQWPALLDAIPASTPLFATMVNGGHIDSADPQTMSRWLEFLDIYVARRVPAPPGPLATAVLGEFASAASMTSSAAPLPALRFTGSPTLAAARAAFVAGTPRVRVLFDNGAGPAGPGDIGSTYAAAFSQWPPQGSATTLYFGAHGTLVSHAPVVPGRATLTLDPAARPATSLPPGGNPWAADPPWDWVPVPAGDGVAFDSTPLRVSTTIVGPATLYLWVESASAVADLQATVTEVRPAAHQEEYVTSGFLRSTNQVDAHDSTALYTDPVYLASEAKALSARAFSLVRIPIDPIAHTFRPGTELRVVLSAPGGDRPIWAFDTLDHGQRVAVGTGGATPSALVVNVVHSVAPTSAAPACGSLRGEPCRAYVAEGNQPR